MAMELPLLENYLAAQPAHIWVERLWQADVFQDPQVLHREMVTNVDHLTVGKLPQVGIPVKVAETPGSIRRHPPLLGEHGAEVLTGAGFTPAEVEALLSSGVVARPQRGGE